MKPSAPIPIWTSAAPIFAGAVLAAAWLGGAGGGIIVAFIALSLAGSPTFGGNPCNAGLLNASVHNQLLCDVHPSQSGHRLIAQTISRTYRAPD